MKMVIVEAWDVKRNKRIKRYTEWFYGPCLLSKEEKKTFALKSITERFARCYVGKTVEFRLYSGNQ